MLKLTTKKHEACAASLRQLSFLSKHLQFALHEFKLIELLCILH